MMIFLRKFLPLTTAVLTLVYASYSQEGALNTDPPKGVTSQQIIEKFAAKEKEFKEARDLYTFRQDVKVQTLDGDTVTGEYREVFDVTYDNQGRHLENVVFAPQNTLTEIMMSPEDLQDIRHLLPFVLTADEISEYDILYVGQQQEDELHCYVFDVAPKKIEKNKRYFQGRIWVDNQDFQIVKNTGKSVPDIKIMKKKRLEENLFPRFTTWREQIDGKHWFPTFSSTDDTLHFNRSDVRIKQTLKFTNYQRTTSTTRAEEKSPRP